MALTYCIVPTRPGYRVEAVIPDGRPTVLKLKKPNGVRTRRCSSGTADARTGNPSSAWRDGEARQITRVPSGAFGGGRGGLKAFRKTG